MTFRLSDGLLQTSIYLYPDEAAAKAGEGVDGCGFLFGWRLTGSEGCILWAVTNRHVVENGGWTIRVNTKDGGVDFIDTTEAEWIYHETADLAVRPIPLSRDIHDFNFINDEWLMSREWFQALDIGPGDPCFTIGRFVLHDGKQRNTPTVRFGQIAQLNSEPIETQNLPPQDSFLVECRSIGGYSGAPVFLWLDRQFYRTTINGRHGPDGKQVFQGAYPTGPWLLGVNWCMIRDWEAVCDASYTELDNGHQVSANTGIMGVIPAWHLKDLFETGAAASKRIELQNAIAARAQFKTSHAVPTGGK